MDHTREAARRCARRRRLAALAAGVLLAGGGATAYASFTASTTPVAQTISTATLAPPTGLTSLHPTVTGGSAGNVQLSWTPSASAAVAGQRIRRATSPAGPYSTIATLAPAAAGYLDTTQPYNADAYYQVDAYVQNWTATSNDDQAFSLASSAGLDATASNAGTALTGPWTTAGSDLQRVALADASRYQVRANWAPRPTGGQTMYALDLADPNDLWSVGAGGTILFTSNGGGTWSAQTSGTTSNLRGISMTSLLDGWAVGDNGTIRVTSNGGATWTAQTSGTTNTLRAVSFVDANHGWAVGSGGTIIATANGGATWTAQTSGTTSILRAVTFVDASHGWAVGDNGTIRVSSNGGATWTAQTSGTTSSLRGVAFPNATTGWVVGVGGVIRTTANGGATWTAQTSGTTRNLQAVAFPDAAHGWAVGQAGTVRVTSNGGATWSAQSSGTSSQLDGVSFVDPANGWVCGTVGTLIGTDNGGVAWDLQTEQYLQLTPRVPTLDATATADSVKVTLVYQANAVPIAGTTFDLLVSTDDGATWDTFPLTVPTLANTDVTSTVDVTGVGFAPPAGLAHMRLRFVATVPSGTGFRTSHDLVHVDVN